MRRVILFTILLTSLQALAETNAVPQYLDNAWPIWDRGDTPYITNNKTTKSIVTWRIVEDAGAECNKLNGKPFPNGALACSTQEWQGGVVNCTIITEVETTMHILGHELRHCFEGAWHK